MLKSEFEGRLTRAFGVRNRAIFGELEREWGRFHNQSGQLSSSVAVPIAARWGG